MYDERPGCCVQLSDDSPGMPGWYEGNSQPDFLIILGSALCAYALLSCALLAPLLLPQAYNALVPLAASEVICLVAAAMRQLGVWKCLQGSHCCFREY